MGCKFFRFKSEREADKWLWQVRVLLGVGECGDWKAFSTLFLRRSCTTTASAPFVQLRT
jgi:hypothetical protein